MNVFLAPVRYLLQRGNDGFQHFPGNLLIGLGLFIGEQVLLIGGQRLKEVHLLRDLRQALAPGLEQSGDRPGIQSGIFHRLTDIGLRHGVEVLRAHGPQIQGVEVGQLLDIEDGGGS